jgi:hydrogenase maturation protease
VTQPRILVAGIGNIFLGDDAFGCEVIRGLSRRTWPENVHVIDFGIRGFDLAYTLLADYDVNILIDTTSRGEAPGTVYTIEPELDRLESNSAQPPLVSAHGMDPMKVLRMVKSMGGQLRRVLLVGCEPETFGPEEGQMGLSAPVEAAVTRAIMVVEALVADACREQAVYE